MDSRLDKVIGLLQEHRNQLSRSEQDLIAEKIEAVFCDQEPVDPLTIMSGDEYAELERRLNRPVDPADPAEVNAFFAKHGIRSNF